MRIRKSSINDFVVLTLIFFVSSLVSYVNHVLAIGLFIFGACFLKWPIKFEHRILIFIIFSFFVFFNMFFFNNLAGVDEQVFYSNLTGFSFKELLMLEYERQVDGVGFAKTRETFPAILDIFFFLFEKEDFNSQYIFIFNSFFWFWAILVWARALAKFYNEKIVRVAVVFLIVSPSTVYWLNNFGKDIFSVSISMIAASQFLNRRYTLSVVLVILASFFRPYSIVLVFAYLLPFVFNVRAKIIAAVGAITFQALLASKPLIAGANTIIVVIFLFLSPNPFNPQSWYIFSFDSWEYSPLLFVVEGCFLGVVFILAILLLLKRFGSVYSLNVLSIFLSISIVATVLVLVGETALAGKDMLPSLGSLGDNFVRKKFAVWPLLSILVGLVIFRLKRNRCVGPQVLNIGPRGIHE